MTAGALSGGTVGAKYRWDWQVDHNPLGTLTTSPVTLDAGKANAFYQSLPWYRMVPSGTAQGFAGRLRVVSGAGTGNSTITASMTREGTYLVAYSPPTGTDARTFSVDLRSMVGNSRARWWDPTSGEYKNSTTGFTLPKTAAAQPMTTPGKNSGGSNDWMLVVDVDTAGGGAGNTGSGGSSDRATPVPALGRSGCSYNGRRPRGSERTLQLFLMALVVIRRRRRPSSSTVSVHRDPRDDAVREWRDQFTRAVRIDRTWCYATSES